VADTCNCSGTGPVALGKYDIFTCISNIDVQSVSNGVIIFQVDWTSYVNKVRLYSIHYIHL